MKVKPHAPTRQFDAFISHSKHDFLFASQLVKDLKSHGLKAWIDDSNVRFGELLRNDLQTAVRNSRVLVLLWSSAAFRSRWVMAEMFTALLSGRPIIPCVLGRKPLPQFLQNTAWLDKRRDQAALGTKLSEAIQATPSRRGNPVAPFMAAYSPRVEAAAKSLALDQQAELQAMSSDRARAAKIHKSVGEALSKLEKAFPFHPLVLSIAGYHRKNAYLARYWDAIQAGQYPKDPVLKEAERYFFNVLCFKPFDPSSINGLGSILLLEQALDAAEFFVRRAIKLAGGYYAAAEQDLALSSTSNDSSSRSRIE
jgi:hypothetical protein